MANVFIVDDNLIGNKKAVKVLLRDVIAYQLVHGYPFYFFTQASLDLAEDEEMIQLMVDAGITKRVFIGVESPNEESLRETKKFQNVRPVGTIVERIHRVQKAGLEVYGGIILGFDNDDSTIFDVAKRRFIKEARLVMTMIGMLHAGPKTPLHARLAQEGRLDLADEPEFGTNTIPLQLSRQELRDGYVKLMNDLSEPEAYFGLLGGSVPQEKLFSLRQSSGRVFASSPLGLAEVRGGEPCHLVRALSALMRGIPEATLRQEYRKRVWRLLRVRPKPSLLRFYIIRCAMHYQQYTMARQMALGHSPIYSSF